MDDDVVGLNGIGDRRDGAMSRCDILRKIVDHPVRHIFDATETQQVQRILGFRQTGAFP